jgi:hypothetical protein
VIACGCHGQADQKGSGLADGLVAQFETIVTHAELSLGCRVLVLLSKDSALTLGIKTNTVNKKKRRIEK